MQEGADLPENMKATTNAIAPTKTATTRLSKLGGCSSPRPSWTMILMRLW